MAREQLLIEEIYQNGVPTYEVVESAQADVVVDQFVEVLRLAFENHPLYKYVPRSDAGTPDYDLTKIVIVDKYTEEAMFLPSVTTSFNSANTRWIQFSQSPFNTVLKYQFNLDGSIKRDINGKPLPSHFEYVGAYDSSITLLISANDTIEREELCNLIHVLLVENLRDEFYMRGIHIKSVSTGGQTETPYRNDYIYQAPVTIEIYTEWKRKIPVGDTLLRIGYQMTVGESIPPTPSTGLVTPLCVVNLEHTFFVPDGTGNSVIPRLELSATSTAAPVTLIFNTTTSRWEVSSFWKTALTQTLIPYENYTIELTKISPVQQYLDYAEQVITVASMFRAIALSQGRLLPDGTKVVNGSFIFSDGKVDIRDGYVNNGTINGLGIAQVIVNSDNSVEMRVSPTNKNESILVARNIVADIHGIVQSGQIFKRYTAQNGNIVETQLATANQSYLDGENMNTMTAVDLFMIMQFANQPFRYTLGMINDKIDNLLTQLGDLTQTITYRAQKIASITSIKQELIVRSEQFLLQQPLGL